MAKVEYYPEAGTSRVTTMLGHVFDADNPVEIEDEKTLEKLRGNRFFKVLDGGSKPAKKDDGKSADELEEAHQRTTSEAVANALKAAQSDFDSQIADLTEERNELREQVASLKAELASRPLPSETQQIAEEAARQEKENGKPGDDDHSPDDHPDEDKIEHDDLTAKHIGGGNYAIMRGDKELMRDLNKDGAAKFNAKTPDEKEDFVKANA